MLDYLHLHVHTPGWVDKSALVILGAVLAQAVERGVLFLEGTTARRARRSSIARVLRRKQVAKNVHATQVADGTHFAGMTIPWAVVSKGPYRPEEIRSTYYQNERSYPAEIDALYSEIRDVMTARERNGELVRPDTPGWKLCGFHVATEGGLEDSAILRLNFQPTTLYRMLSTELQVDRPIQFADGQASIRERYGAPIDLRSGPVLEVATYWGIGLNVITKDKQIVFGRRAATMAEDPGVLYPGVSEGAMRPRDAAPNGAPDHISTARRGAMEELGIDLQTDQVRWLSLGVNVERYAYGLLGEAHIDLTFDQLLQRRSIGEARDHWENTELVGVAFEPKSVADLLTGEGNACSGFTGSTT